MELNQLVSALLGAGSVDLNEIGGAVCSAMCAYLVNKYGAHEQDAADAAQQTMLIIFERSLVTDIKDPQKSGAYVLSILRNEYLKVVRRHNQLSEPNEEYYALSVDPNQLEEILYIENMRILSRCTRKLSAKNRLFLKLLRDNPDIEAESLAERLNISVTNVWTRKHRLLKLLEKCIRNYSGPL